ncbi:serine/threonine-protein kinase [Clostridium sp. 'White wine YQ']|uniref:serine/threonine-protein kinase n=1 Tax=Clostridium sp. 'White wine YQ' TaxID=3027474 RepID=UPI00236608DC|nr:serine/threonine-protein kinase [Clostridium sp. 'White wine YQ']MDD7795698.1 serine/threonine-protein kinase [Clostridium sp. 'White wine YQ']
MLNCGEVLDKKYKIVKHLGNGGMGTVYLCKDINSGEFYAIKEMKEDNEFKIDVLSEVNMLNRLEHPGIPRVTDTFSTDGNFYMVEDYIEGWTLKEYLTEKGMVETEEACHIILKLCDIVGYLHSFNPPIIYRDLKPTNIMITKYEKVVLIDFGTTKDYKYNKNSDTVVIGTTGYAAPEQYGFGQSCIQTDIYGMGAIMYFLFTRKEVSRISELFKDDNYTKVEHELQRIIKKCLEFDIADRYKTIDELRKEIDGYLREGRYEKTSILISSKDNYNKSTKKPRLRKNILGFLVLSIAALFVVYSFLNNNTTKAEDKNNVSNPVEDSSIDTLPKPEDSQPIKEDTVIDHSDQTKVDDNNINKENNNKEIYKKPNKNKGKNKNKH